MGTGSLNINDLEERLTYIDCGGGSFVEIPPPYSTGSAHFDRGDTLTTAILSLHYLSPNNYIPTSEEADKELEVDNTYIDAFLKCLTKDELW